ncbi:MAG: hypothetical protein ACQEXJ_18495 [Myxococcota bacterium]
MMRLPALAVLLAALVAAGCDSDLPEPSEVDALRVLGVRAEPPELRDPGESEVTALVADGEGEVSYAWELCLVPGAPTEGFPCLDEAARFDLGAEPTATVSVPPLDDFLAAPELRGFEVDLEEGFDVMVKLTVTDTTEREVTAIKRVKVSRREEQNTNPVLLGLRIDGEEWAEGQAAVVPPDQEVELLPVWDPESMEAFVDGNDDRREEDPLLSWYAEGGDFDKERTRGGVPDNTWTTPTLEDLDGREEIGLWLVLRDRRGGLDWLERRVRVQAE